MIRKSILLFHLRMALALALFFAGAPAIAGGGVTVKPLQNPPGEIAYPRIVAGTSEAVRRQVNKALAEREKADRDQRRDCLAAIRQAGQKPDADSFNETIEASYVSARYLSIDVRRSYFCATAYPTNDDEDPLTFDLETGKALNWNKVFKPGFLPQEGEAKPSALTRLYRARYAASDEERECKDVVSGQDPFEGGAHLWLDSAKGGLVAQPDFPHVVAACARAITFRPKDLAPYADPAFLHDFEAAAAPACSAGAHDCPITLRIAPGGDTATVKGVFRENEDCCAYVLEARAGQILTWHFKGPAARETIRYPDGRTDGPGIPQKITLPATGSYIFSASPDLMVERVFGPFTLTIQIR
jgi:hypothetical protein